MSLKLSLVLEGDNKGAAQALSNTSAGIKQLGTDAGAASKPVKDVSTSLEATATSAAKAAQPTKQIADAMQETAVKSPAAATGIANVGNEAATAAGKIGGPKGFGALAMGAIGGLAGAFGAAALTTAIGLATQAATDYFEELTNGPANIADDLQRHKDLIGSIKGLWTDNKTAASDYGHASKEGVRFQAQQNVERLKGDFASESQRAGDGTMASIYGRGQGNADGQPFGAAIEKYRQDLKDGKADVIAFRNEVAKIAEALTADDAGRSFAERVLGDTQKAAELQAELTRSVDLYKSLTGDADAATRALGDNAQAVAATDAEMKAALPTLARYNQYLRGINSVTISGPDGTPVTARPGEVGGGFAAGGYTGTGGRHEPAGVVHKGEVVFNQDDVRRHGGPHVVEAMRLGMRGYAAGGMVGGYTRADGTTVAPYWRAGDGAATDASNGLATALNLLKGVVTDVSSNMGNFDGAIDNLISKLLSMAGSAFDQANPQLGGAGSFVTELLGSLFGGFREGGGSVSPGRAYVVGEKRPEIFIPSSPGTIMPNTGGGGFGGGSFAFTQHITNNTSAKVTTRERKGSDGSVIQELVIGTVQRSMANDEFRANGVRGKTMSR